MSRRLKPMELVAMGLFGPGTEGVQLSFREIADMYADTSRSGDPDRFVPFSSRILVLDDGLYIGWNDESHKQDAKKAKARERRRARKTARK